jgi:two-component system response regulator WspF
MRIAIVNDNAMAIEALRRVVLELAGAQLAWIARDGADAVEQCRQDTPDLILMDLMMPVMDGAEATRRIMAQSPCPILVVTATVEGHSGKVFEALGAGALDVVQTPLANSNQSRGGAGLRFKINAVGRMAAGEKSERQRTLSAAGDPPAAPAPTDRLIAIGASAGGPATLAAILGGLPRDFPAAIVIVQHVDAQFVPLMAGWLHDRTALSVQIAREGDQPQSGTALIAGTNEHLVLLKSQSLKYTPEPRDCCYRPSIDVFFQSAAAYWKGELVGVLLTGMGRDGASGLKRIRDSGSLTLAQDSSSCAVYGMPKAAAELNAAVKILNVNGITKSLIDFATAGKPVRQE